MASVRRGERLKVTSRRKVIAEIVAPATPAAEAEAARARLRGSVLRYDAPLEPVLDPLEGERDR